MSTDPLDDLAHRAAARPFFLGHALADYALAHGLSDLGLARRLGCAVEALAMLRLCRLPRDAGEVAHPTGPGEGPPVARPAGGGPD
jgi:hypothetical protein